MAKSPKRTNSKRPAQTRSPKGRATKTGTSARRTAQISKSAGQTVKPVKGDHTSKQARVVAMLRAPAGASITAMMKATGWRKHSVRGFLAGVVRKRLELKLASDKRDGERIYRIVDGDTGRSTGRVRGQRSA